MPEEHSSLDIVLSYLFEYGWAILVVLVVVSALYSMGIFNVPENNIPSEVFDYEEACESLSNLFAENSNCTLKRGKVGDAFYICYCCFNLPEEDYRYCIKYNIEIMEDDDFG
jgi:hypothetical protein